jgi:hypothetical protein
MRIAYDHAQDAYPSKLPTDQHLKAEHLSAAGMSHRKERTSSSSRGAPATPSLASEYRGYSGTGGSSAAVDMLVQLKEPLPFCAAEEYGSTCSSGSHGLAGSGSTQSLSGLLPRSGSGSGIASSGNRAAAAAALSARQLLAAGEASDPTSAAAAPTSAATLARQGGASGTGYTGSTVVPVRHLGSGAPSGRDSPLFDDQHQSAAAVAIAAAVAAAAARPSLAVPRRRLSSSSEDQEDEGVEDSSSTNRTTASLPLHVQLAKWEEEEPEDTTQKKGKTKSRMAALLSSCECKATGTCHY